MKKNLSKVVATRFMPDRELEGVMSTIGMQLMARGYYPRAHTMKLLVYEAEGKAKRGVLVGGFVPVGPVAPGAGVSLRKQGSREARVVVQVTDLPISFSVDEGSNTDITVALAFGISAPAAVFPAIESVLAPYVVDPEQVKARAGEFLQGVTFQKKVPDVTCEHCGRTQEVTIPTTISSIEANRGYGPGGSAAVVCSNPECRKTFTVEWDSVEVEVKSL